MPSQAELQGMLGRSLSRRDVLKGAVAGAAYLYGFSRQDVQAQSADPLKNPDAKDVIGFADPAFYTTWARSDQLVAEGRAPYSWLWGPAPNTPGIMEQYNGGQRLVQYFDKSRMEINDPNGDPNSIWFVTNGLLAKELMTGRKKTGDGEGDYVQLEPARIGVAGDATWEWAMTYEKLGGVMNVPPPPEHAYLSGLGNWIEPWGEVKYRDDLAHNWGVQANIYVPETDHVVANVFWDFMTQRGPIVENGQVVEDQPLFPNPFYGTGYPITEPFWVRTRYVDSSLEGGYRYKDEVVQAFERRTLTYTPDNDPPYKVQSGNIGQHYYAWAYQHSA